MIALDRCSSNISHCINLKNHKIVGLKSHDYPCDYEKITTYSNVGNIIEAISSNWLNCVHFLESYVQRKDEGKILISCS